MIQKTKDYDLFKLREDNREKIDQGHIKRLIESIKSRNLLDLRPIIVNDSMEILDGQHRFLAAKFLGLEIYYQKEKKLDAVDIIHMNISKPWTIGDYLNFYCIHEYEEYKKLRDFMKKHNLTLKVSISITIGASRFGFHEFRMGQFKFTEESLDSELDICWDTINYLKKMNGYSRYTESNRFWMALLRLVRHPEFELEKWNSNMQKMIDHFSPKATLEDYCRMLQNIYNWRNMTKIKLMDEEI